MGFPSRSAQAPHLGWAPTERCRPEPLGSFIALGSSAAQTGSFKVNLSHQSRRCGWQGPGRHAWGPRAASCVLPGGLKSQSAGPEPQRGPGLPGALEQHSGTVPAGVGAAAGRGLTLKWPELPCRAVFLLSVGISRRACSGSLSRRRPAPVASRSPLGTGEGRKEGCQGSGAGTSCSAPS